MCTIRVMAKKAGRPFSANKMGVRIDIRLSGDDKAKYDSAARKAGLRLSAWIRLRLDAAAAAETIGSGRRGNRTRPEKAGP